MDVDLTHEVLVCAGCSGMHRELGDRIKSISLSTFTQEEIHALQKQNNDDFNRVWMAK
jgi:hypothetical protein